MTADTNNRSIASSPQIPLTKRQKRQAAGERRVPFSRVWLGLQTDCDIAIMAAISKQRLTRKKPALSDDEAGRIRRILEEHKRRTGVF